MCRLGANMSHINAVRCTIEINRIFDTSKTNAEITERLGQLYVKFNMITVIGKNEFTLFDGSAIELHEPSGIWSVKINEQFVARPQTTNNAQ
jgi:hypothetical protein